MYQMTFSKWGKLFKIMFTYLIKSHNLYKIGKARDVDKRVKTYRTHNPKFELIKIIEGDCERSLHSIYHHKRIKGEWFDLDDYDLSKIDELVKFILDETRIVARIYEPVVWRK